MMLLGLVYSFICPLSLLSTRIVAFQSKEKKSIHFISFYHHNDRRNNIRIFQVNNDLIDPFDYLKEYDRVLKPQSSDSMKTLNNNFTSTSSSITTTTTTIKIPTNDLLQSKEAVILKSLPTNMLISFLAWQNAVTLRIAFIMITVHVMLLIPMLRYIYFSLNTSIYPYLYIGPTLFVIPFVYSWLWENNRIENTYIDQNLFKMIHGLKQIAVKKLPLSKKKYENMITSEKGIASSSSSSSSSSSVLIATTTTTTIAKTMMIDDENDTISDEYAYIKVVAGIDEIALIDEMKYLLREKGGQLSNLHSMKVKGDDYLAGAKYLGNMIVSSNNTESYEQLKQIQQQFTTDDERKIFEEVVQTIETVFDKLSDMVDKVKDKKKTS